MTLKILCVCPLSQNLDFTVSLNDHRLYTEIQTLLTRGHIKAWPTSASVQTGSSAADPPNVSKHDEWQPVPQLLLTDSRLACEDEGWLTSHKPEKNWGRGGGVRGLCQIAKHLYLTHAVLITHLNSTEAQTCNEERKRGG